MLYLLQTVDFDSAINAILLNSHTHSNLVSLIISSKLQSSLAADFLQSTMRSRKISKYSITGQNSVMPAKNAFVVDWFGNATPVWNFDDYHVTTTLTQNERPNHS